MVAALVVGDEALAAGRHPTHRALQSARGESHDRFFRIELALVAEAAADVGGDDAHRALRQAELLGDHAPDVVRHLGRTQERELGVAGRRYCKRSARLDRGADQTIVEEFDTRPRARLTQTRLATAFSSPRAQRKQILPGAASCSCGAPDGHCGMSVDDRGEGVVFHLHQLGGVERPTRIAVRDHSAIGSPT